MTDLVRLIVLDDDPMQRDLVERALSREGFEVRPVATVAELQAEAARSTPDIVLIDINLPDALPERSIEIARKAAAGACVVLYSAWDEAEARAVVARARADAFISKSESVLALGARLRELRAASATRSAPR